jgi:hypothetical protein
MKRKLLGMVTALIALAAISPTFASSFESRDPSLVLARRWLRRPIIISLSTSFVSPPANIKPDSDVLGAVRRALQSWTGVADIQVLETTSTTDTISPVNAGDGVNLITISPANAAVFGSSQSPSQTRVFYDSGGAIIEADIALNPNVPFSTDGTPGTFDLESTFAHEIGHLLGLEHSAIIGATMQPRQAKNGVYGLPAITQRSLSADDAASARALYGPYSGTSSISGRLTTNTSGRARSIFGAHIFAEDVATGSVVASSISQVSGNYRLDGLWPGVYRVFGQSLDGAIPATDIGLSGGGQFGLADTTPVFRSFVASASAPSQSLNLNTNSALRLSFFVFNVAPTLTPRLIGMNGELSTAALPLRAGETFTIYVAGENVDEISAEGISISSPLIHVDASTLTQQDFGISYPVISFDVKVDANIQPGDYTVRLQSPLGEVAYLPGALTIEPK